MTKPNDRKPNGRLRRLLHEGLEDRRMCAQGNGAFAGYGSLTFSIAPDGTHVGSNTSELHSGFNNVAPTQVWQQAIAKSLQKWSALTNINFGNVFDNGAASGVYGPTRGDERFGDIRITGFDFSDSIHAEAVSESARSVGTWSGDVFFNTAADWPSIEAIEAIALHEVGHILGLGHSDDPASPMFTHGQNSVLELTPTDIANLQKIHGSRKPDPNEGDSGNNSIDRASRIRGDADGTAESDFNGSQVWMQFGDLHRDNDRDVYEIKTAINYLGPLTVQLRTQGLSLARLSADITDRDGRILAHATTVGDFGGIATLTLNQPAAEGRHYLHIYRQDDPFWSTGDYSVTVATPTRVAQDGQAISDWIQSAHRWYYDSDRTEDGFTWKSTSLNNSSIGVDDRHTDDALDRGTILPVVFESEVRSLRSVVGSVTDLVDVDHFRVIAPKVLAGRSELIVDVESLDFDGLVPLVSLFDRRGALLRPEVRVRGYGQTQLVVKNVQSEQEFIIEVRADAVSDAFRTGNYSLSATFGIPSVPPTLLLAGNLNADSLSVEKEWYIAKPQLFGISIEGKLPEANASDLIWLSIFDSERRLVAGLVSPLNELRSAPGVFLDSGTYFIQITSNRALSGSSNLAFRIMVETPSHPVGVLLGPKQVQPLFLCPGSTTEYCYPNSTQPTTATQQVGLTPAVPLPPPNTNQTVSSPSRFFWANRFSPTNPTNARDANGDGTVNPLDALVIINAINEVGVGAVPMPPAFLGYLDTNANGSLDPLDVLQVVNFINEQ